MKRLLIIVCAFFLLTAVADHAEAQMKRKDIIKNNKRIANFRGKKTHFDKYKRYNSVGVSLNALNYFGDLAPNPRPLSTDLSLTKPSVGVFFEHRFGPFYTLRSSFNYGTIRGDDFESANPNDNNARYRYTRNLHFRNRIKELAVVGVFDYYRNENTHLTRVNWTPYAFAGLVVFHHEPEAMAPATDLQGNPLPEAGQWVKLRPLGTEGQFAELDPSDINHGIKAYKPLQVAIPFGIGVRYKMNSVMDFSFEIGVRYTFTDYLDDVSGNYVNLDVFGTNELARAMSYRSNEQVAAVSGTPRDLSNPNIAELYARRYAYDGYEVVSGFGHENRWNYRGNKNNNDLYIVTSIRVSYILGASFTRAKFR
jgi:hypothetical protein